MTVQIPRLALVQFLKIQGEKKKRFVQDGLLSVSAPVVLLRMWLKATKKNRVLAQGYQDLLFLSLGNVINFTTSILLREGPADVFLLRVSNRFSEIRQMFATEQSFELPWGGSAAQRGGGTWSWHKKGNFSKWIRKSIFFYSLLSVLVLLRAPRWRCHVSTKVASSSSSLVRLNIRI